MMGYGKCATHENELMMMMPKHDIPFDYGSNQGAEVKK